MKMPTMVHLLHLLIGGILLLLVAPRSSAQWWTTVEPDPGCPPPDAVTPCLCEWNELDQVHSFYCRDSITSSRLSEIFNTVEFPVTRMADFTAEYCTLNSLPAGVFGPMKFESVTVSICELSSVDPSVLEGQADALKTLVLSHNALVTFPFQVNLPWLESLHLGDNHLTALPALNYPELKFLDVNLNAIEQLDPQLLRGTPNLERLYLETNQIARLPNGFVSGTPKLEEVYLHHNSLTTILAGTFDFSQNVREVIDVDLHNNAISIIEEGAFTFPMGTCPRVFLDFNDIKTLPSGAFEPIVAPMAANQCPGLFLTGNNVQCDCSLAWLVENPSYKAAIIDGFNIECDGVSLPNWTADSIGC